MSQLQTESIAIASNDLTVSNPFDQSMIRTVKTKDASEIEAAIRIADATFADRDRWLSIERRIEILDRASLIMIEKREQLAKLATQEGGKPLSDSLIETDRAIDGLRCCIETIRTQAGTEIPMGINAASTNRFASTHFEPIGTVLAFSAFNHPLNLIVHQVAPAIAAGCPVIVKPAEATPLSCFRFVEILHEAGLPKNWCQAVLTETIELATQMVSDPRFAFFSFIGSAKVGWMLRKKLAPGTRCALEHGGSAAVIVDPCSDMKQALPLICKGGFYHAGQVCVSVQRLYVHESISRRIAQQFALMADSLHVGDPMSMKTDVGPLIRPAEVERVQEWVDEAIDQGAEAFNGGLAMSETTFAPTVLYDPPSTCRVSTQEIFGPVVCIYPYRNLDEAIERANATRYSFQASIFTQDLDVAFRASRRLNASTVLVNDHTAFRVDWMPFAGARESGLGIGGIPHTIRDMQHEKLVVFRSTEIG